VVFWLYFLGIVKLINGYGLFMGAFPADTFDGFVDEIETKGVFGGIKGIFVTFTVGTYFTVFGKD